MGISVIIATRGRPEVLASTLASLRQCDPLPSEVIVVDGDEDRSAEPVVAAHRARADLPAARYLHDSPGSSTRQRNRGIDAAREEILVFADDDVDFAPDIFGALSAAYTDAGVVGATARVFEPDSRKVGGSTSRLRALLHRGREGTMTRFGYPRRLVHVDTPCDVEFVHGCLMSARREAAAAVRFDELMTAMTGYALAEDEDFGYRLSRLGRVRYVPEAVVHHHNLGFRSAGTREINRLLVRNRAYLFRKNFPRSLPAVVQFHLMVLLLAVHRAANREWSGVKGLAQGWVDVVRGAG